MVEKKVKVAILISGQGTNMVNLLKNQQNNPKTVIDYKFVASNNFSLGLSYAASYNLPSFFLPYYASKASTKFESKQPKVKKTGGEKPQTKIIFFEALESLLNCYQIDLIALAGFMKIIPVDFVARWHRRIINIHPSLLPKYKGMNCHARVLESSDKYHGCSIHIVEEKVDEGPILAQSKLKIRANDSPEILKNRVLQLEHRLYSKTLEKYCINNLDFLTN